MATACAVQSKNRPLILAIRLLPWLVSGTVAIGLAQVMKADLEKGWAAWLQAFVTVTIGTGDGYLTWMSICDNDEVLPNIMKIRGSNSCLAPAEILSVGLAEY